MPIPAALFCDIGGVVLSNGWDSQARYRGILHFELDKDEFEERHNSYSPLHELGILSLDDYLNGVVFHRRRPFSREEFIDFMHAQSHLHADIFALLLLLKQRHPALKVVSMSNEGAELARYRAHKFQLLRLFDLYLVSAFVHLRKPDPAIYRLALNLLQLEPAQVIYIDDRSSFVEVADGLGIASYQHSSCSGTRFYLEKLLGTSLEV